MKLRYVIDVEEGLITQHSHEIGYLNNGVECYFVEVTTKKGIQWGIWAYGEDAIDLYKETLNILSKP
ncbi:MAG: hypothetical protein WB511_14075 [Nitrososphaeraceae archaeon]